MRRVTCTLLLETTLCQLLTSTCVSAVVRCAQQCCSVKHLSKQHRNHTCCIYAYVHNKSSHSVVTRSSTQIALITQMRCFGMRLKQLCNNQGLSKHCQCAYCAGKKKGKRPRSWALKPRPLESEAEAKLPLS
jgi:hypothetical protein